MGFQGDALWPQQKMPTNSEVGLNMKCVFNITVLIKKNTSYLYVDFHVKEYPIYYENVCRVQKWDTSHFIALTRNC